MSHYNMTALLRLCIFRYKHDKLRSISCILASVVSWGEKDWLNTRRWGKRRKKAVSEVANDQADISCNHRCDFLPSHHNFIHFLQSGFNKQSNQHDTRQTITKRRQCLRDGLMWQIWARRCVRDRRGTQCNSEARGLIPDQNWETGSMPLTCRPSAQTPLSHEKLTGVICDGSSWPTFTSLSLSVPIKIHWFFNFPSSISVFVPWLLLSQWCVLIFFLSFISFPVCFVAFPLSSLVPFLHLWPQWLWVSFLQKHHTTSNLWKLLSYTFKTCHFVIWNNDPRIQGWVDVTEYQSFTLFFLFILKW